MTDRQNMEQKIARFLSAEASGVAGASTNRAKYGNSAALLSTAPSPRSPHQPASRNH
ncbi:MAG: hypothetical protein R2864_07315 [Syntrophotaleaceae bacterium]